MIDLERHHREIIDSIRSGRSGEAVRSADNLISAFPAHDIAAPGTAMAYDMYAMAHESHAERLHRDGDLEQARHHRLLAIDAFEVIRNAYQHTRSYVDPMQSSRHIRSLRTTGQMQRANEVLLGDLTIFDHFARWNGTPKAELSLELAAIRHEAALLWYARPEIGNKDAAVRMLATERTTWDDSYTSGPTPEHVVALALYTDQFEVFLERGSWDEAKELGQFLAGGFESQDGRIAKHLRRLVRETGPVSELQELDQSLRQAISNFDDMDGR